MGDKIRFVAMPTGFSRNNCHPDTLRVYRLLIARRHPVRVHEIDENKMPWIQFRERRANGRLWYQSLMINHDGWVRVRHRT
ncbi:MAG: hypothetical protein ACJ8C4_21245 [Gemmataceae bacterium]